jgi:signal transduction histidine kinase/CheY-like chemotaxis protein
MWLFILAAPYALAQNGPDPSYPDSSADRLEQVTLQLGWKHQFQFGGYYAALEKGFYSVAGLDVNFLEGGPGKTCVLIMMSGRAQFCADDGDNIFHFIKGVPLVALAAIFQNSPTALLTLRDSGLNTPHDLIGKRVEAIHGGFPMPEIMAMFRREGVSLNKIEKKEDSFGVDKLINGDVDAIYGYVSNEPKLLEKKGVAYNLIRPRSYGIDFYGDSLFTSKQEVEDHTERVKAFREASLRGWRYAMANQEEIVDLILRKYNRQLSKDHLLYEARTIEKLMQIKLVEVGHMNPARWRHMADLMVDQGLVKSGYSLKEFIYDPNFRPDYTRIVVILVGVVTLSGLGIAFLVYYNARMSKEISERKRAESDLARAKEEAEFANQTKSRFLAAASHDLRQPIHAISLFSTALQTRLKESRNAKLVSKIQSSLNSLGGMLDGLLDMSRLENHAIVSQPHDFSVQTILDEIISEHTPAADAKNLDLTVVGSSAVLHSDQTLLSRIIGNFVSNSIRYTERGRVLIGCRLHGDTVRLEVWDTGIGMSTDDVDHIFDPYLRLDGARIHAADGLGLGLSISDGLAQLLGHPLTVRSTEGAGSLFAIEVPKGTRVQDPAKNKPAAPTYTDIFHGHIVLVVDDNANVLDGMKTVLTDWGCHVVVARSQADALDAARTLDSSLDVVITDLNLSQGDTGIALLENIENELGRNVPAIIVSGDTQPERRREIEAAGYFLLTKPIQPVSLRPLLRRQLRPEPM